MQNTELQPIHHEPALLFNEKKTLIIADLHIGIESELRENGVQTPSQTPLMEKRLISLCKKNNIQQIIILGDIKHMILSTTNQERTDVRRFLEAISSCGTLHIIPGNHDGNIHRLLSPEIEVHPSDGFVFEGIGFVHGHRWPKEEVMMCSQIVIAHTHPTIMLTDRLGYKTFEPCWLRGSFVQEKLKVRYPSSLNPKILVMPAFNPLCGGIAVNRDPLLGPLGTILDINNAEVYLLDGACLGKVADIK